MTTILARFRFPSIEICPRHELYLRTIDDAEFSMQTGAVQLGPNGIVEFNTYFNTFSVGRWHRHTTLDNVAVVVHVSGSCRLELVHQRLNGQPAVVAATAVDPAEASWEELALPPLHVLEEGSAFLRVTSLGGAVVISGGRWQTRDQPPQPVRLGVVITTFNRNDHVKSNIDRLVCALHECPGYLDRLEVLVVDNASNLELHPAEDVPLSVVASTNTGGAGGFTRGLMHFRGRPGTTHVLFMDDDVTFDPDIVFRTIQLLSFARDAKLCIAGAMLIETTSTTEQFEAGGQFMRAAIYPTRAMGQGLDLLSWEDVQLAENQADRIDYGAWWYFAFPIDLTRENPIPAFLRGDDVCWGLLHAGAHTVTFNGIGLWHDNFDGKNGPSTWFYDTRNFALVGVLAVPGFGSRHLLWRYLNICGRSLLCFKYDSASRITFGMREFLRGPGHWLNVDHASLHRQVTTYDGERIRPLADEHDEVPDLCPRSRVLKNAAALCSIALLGGHVLPERLRRKPIGAVPIQHRAIYAAARRNAILYRSTESNEGFIAQRDRSRFFSLLADMVVTAARVLLRFRALRTAYRAAYPEMVSDEYWERQFAQPDPAADAHPSPRGSDQRGAGDRLGRR